jgi:hypothetical protein
VQSTVHLYPVDGAASRVPSDATPWAYRDARWAQVIVGVDPDSANSARLRDWTVDYWEALHPHSAGGAYVNFLMREGDGRVRASYRGNYTRLRDIKGRYDPGNVFRVNQDIEPATTRRGRPGCASSIRRTRAPAGLRTAGGLTFLYLTRGIGQWARRDRRPLGAQHRFASNQSRTTACIASWLGVGDSDNEPAWPPSGGIPLRSGSTSSARAAWPCHLEASGEGAGAARDRVRAGRDPGALG